MYLCTWNNNFIITSMKKLFLTLVMLISFVAVSHADWYRAYEFAFAQVKNGNYTWDDWEKSDLKINVDTDREVITIYSDKTQKYVITGVYNNGDTYKDDSGGETVKFFVVDQDNDEGELRLRVKDGDLQLYVDFNDCAWVYNIRPL